MFGTEMHVVTFGILVFQVLVIFTQLHFYLARPNDKSRLRFLILVFVYIIHNFILGFVPDTKLPVHLFLQYILAYLSGILAGIYLIFYIYKEFEIFSYKFLGIKPLCYIMFGSFFTLFVIPYYVTNNFLLAKRLFLSVPIFFSLAFFFRLGNVLIKLYKEGRDKSRYFRYRIISGYLGLLSLPIMIILVAIGHYQVAQLSVLNFGLIVMIIAYTIDFIVQRQKEALVLEQINNKGDGSQIQIANTLINTILSELQQFEDDKKYLEGKITLSILAQRFNTNSRYLSQIVNTHKGKTFTDYINDLRINNLKERLEIDPRFRQYTIKAIAKEIGYTSTEAFANAFYKKEGIKLSKYIKKVRDAKTKY